MPDQIALYYPFIDPPDPSMIRTAILYWDHVHTIVPSTVTDPYKNPWSRTARDLGFLRPSIIHPDTPQVQKASLEFIEDLNSRIIVEDTDIASEHAALGADQARLNAEKVSSEFRSTVLGGVIPDAEGFYTIGQNFALPYMARLAALIAESNGQYASTDRPKSYNVVMSHYATNEEPSVDGAERLLAQVSIDSLAIPSHVSLNELIRFRDDHYDLLKKYRIMLRKTARTISGMSGNGLIREVERIVKEEVTPSTDEVSAKLSEKHIDFGMAATEVVTGAGVGLFVSGGHILGGVVGAAIKIGFTYKKLLRESNKVQGEPFAYLYHARRIGNQ